MVQRSLILSLLVVTGAVAQRRVPVAEPEPEYEPEPEPGSRVSQLLRRPSSTFTAFGGARASAASTGRGQGPAGRPIADCAGCIQVVSTYSLTGKSQDVVDDFLARFRIKVPASQRAQGNLSFHLYRQQANSGTGLAVEQGQTEYVSLEVWQSDASLADHGRSSLVQDFVQFLNDNSIESDLEVYTLVL